MSALVKCPNPECGRASRVPETGRTLLCPHCRQKFQASTREKPLRTLLGAAIQVAVPEPAHLPAATLTPEPIILEYRFSTLRWGGAFFVLLGALCLPGAFLQPGPGQRPAPPEQWLICLLLGVGLLGLGAGLVWLAIRQSERFELDTLGITWRRGGQVLVYLPLDEIQHIIVKNHDSLLIIQSSAARDARAHPGHVPELQGVFAAPERLGPLGDAGL